MALEIELTQLYSTAIVPFMKRTVTQGYFDSPTGSRLFYIFAPHTDAHACIIISSGRGESALKYAELIYDLHQQGYAVFAHDHAGQGLSERLVKNSMIGYVDRFSRYAEDFHAVYQQILYPVLTAHNQQTLDQYLLCHSMGSAIATEWLASYPNEIQKAIFCGPMFSIQAPIAPWIARCLMYMSVTLDKWRKRPASYFLGQQDYLEIEFDKNRLTSSQVRYQLFRDLYQQQQELQVGGVSTQWLIQALAAIEKLPEQLSKIKIPILALLAAQDTVVDSSGAEKLLNQCDNTQVQWIAGAKHELLIEADSIRNQCLSTIISFLQE